MAEWSCRQWGEGLSHLRPTMNCVFDECTESGRPRQPSHVYCTNVERLKSVYSFLWETYRRTTERHLPYGIIRCYLPPDTDCVMIVFFCVHGLRAFTKTNRTKTHEKKLRVTVQLVDLKRT